MSEHTKSFEGNEQPDFLSIINSEVEKVEPINKVPPTPSVVQSPPLGLPEPLPSPSDKPKEELHLKASTFAEPVLPIDWLSEPVQEYIRIVSESYGCPQEYVWLTASIPLALRQGKRYSSLPTLMLTIPATFSAWWVNPAVTRLAL